MLTYGIYQQYFNIMKKIILLLSLVTIFLFGGDWEGDNVYIRDGLYFDGVEFNKDTIPYADTAGHVDSASYADTAGYAEQPCYLDVNISKSTNINSVYSLVTLTAYVNQTGVTYSWDGGSGTNKTYNVITGGTYECIVSKSGCVNDTAEIFVHNFNFKNDYNFDLPTYSANDTLLSKNSPPDSVLYSDTSGYASNGGIIDQTYYNTGLGEDAFNASPTGTFNTTSGYQSQYTLTSGTGNSSFGSKTLYTNSTGTFNTAGGLQSLYNATGDFNIGLGSSSGLYNTTENNHLYINSIDRGSFSNDTSKSIIWGIQNTDETLQRLRLNANVNITKNLTVDGDSAIFNGYIKCDSIYTTKAAAWADYAWEPGYKVPFLYKEIQYAKKNKSLKPLHKKTNNINKRIESTIESLERLYIQVFRNFKIIYLILLVLFIWNILLTIKLRKK